MFCPFLWGRFVGICLHDKASGGLGQGGSSCLLLGGFAGFFQHLFFRFEVFLKWAHEGEEDNVTQVILGCQKGENAVYPHTPAGHWGHAVFHCAEIVFINLEGVQVAAGGGFCLFKKAIPLILRIHNFRIGVDDFPGVYEELEGFADSGVVVRATGEGFGGCGVADYESGFDEVRSAHFFVEGVAEIAVAEEVHVFDFDFCFFDGAAEGGGVVVVVVYVNSAVFFDKAAEFDAGPGRGEVDCDGFTVTRESFYF